MELQTIELQKIIPDPCQPRKFFDLAALEELASSIEQYGLLSPIIVRKQGARYIIVAGERRYRAMLLNKMTHANCIVRNHIDFREVSLIENVQREDLNPLEEAEALSSLMIEKHYTQEELSKLIGKSRPYITNQLRLLRLDDETKQALLDKKISEAHGRSLISLDNLKLRKKLLHAIIEHHLSVRATEKKIKQWKQKEKQQRDVYLKDLLQQLEEKLGTKVTLQGSAKKGKLSLFYFQEEDLASLIEKLLQDE
ncbi:ParB/RepB/Spo0J family partition protein [Filifactor alocis]|uniref:ParB/RepB/Spo0J family partition protein n=1 Tax=Filifactor alocis TaxID=143361 RepID=UPI003C6FA149